MARMKTGGEGNAEGGRRVKWPRRMGGWGRALQLRGSGVPGAVADWSLRAARADLCWLSWSVTWRIVWCARPSLIDWAMETSRGTVAGISEASTGVHGEGIALTAV